MREGLTFDYPVSTAIIPDPKTMFLREFLGADWVAQEFVLSPNDVKEIYQVDVGKSFNAYKGVDDGVTVTSRGGFVVLQDKTARTDNREGNDGRSCVRVGRSGTARTGWSTRCATATRTSCASRRRPRSTRIVSGRGSS